MDTPELILDNGKLTTLDPKRPEAAAVAHSPFVSGKRGKRRYC